ncbi:MAG TPA: peptide-methionine (S)-S-oxide reductase MsrA [Rhodanobacter sp.]|nr:peptide-methionine (S)-S-oxide reductase MsrA [Rhodanobacter sp.]
MTHHTTCHVLPIALLLLLVTACQPVSATGEATLLPAPRVDAAKTATHGDQVAVFAGGCFWGIEAVFQHIKGVTQATAGYSGGHADSAHYDVVSSGGTGHAESVRVHFDPARVSYGTLLQAFFSVALDPTELNRQGPDHGSQYRSVIFYTNDEQRQIATAYLAQLTAAKSFRAPIVTQVVPLKAFYVAEDYHQDYFEKHPHAPYIVYNDAPKVAHLKQLFPDLYQSPRQFVQVQLH